MKRSGIIFAGLIMGVSVAAGATWVLDPKQAPPLGLPDAYAAAMGALGGLTNAFHCNSANFVGEQFPPGAWKFEFCSTNGALKTVYVSATHVTREFEGCPATY